MKKRLAVSPARLASEDDPIFRQGPSVFVPVARPLAAAPRRGRYKVVIADNFHYMDEDAHGGGAVYDSAEEALAAAKRIVDQCLRDDLQGGTPVEQLFDQYKSFGDDPFIVALAGPEVDFSAWDYARERCRELGASS